MMTTSAYMRLLLQMTLYFTLFRHTTPTAFPENSLPLTRSNITDFTGLQYFVGDGERPVDGVQLVKRIKVVGREYIIVSGNSVVFFLDADKQSQEGRDLEVDMVLEWDNNGLCASLGYCFDRMLIVLALDELGTKIFVCASGTHKSPLCRMYKASRNETTDELTFTVTAEIRSPLSKTYLPSNSDNKVTHLVADGKLYTTTFWEPYSSEPLMVNNRLDNLVKMNMNYAQRTVEKALADLDQTTNFIGSYELSDRILIFINELVALNTGQRLHVTEVASICKNDPGYDDEGRRTIWSQTFIKTRLNCQYGAHTFTNIQDVSFPPAWEQEKEEDMIFYATFAMYESTLPSSAVCSFRMGDVLDSFKGHFIRNEKESPEAFDEFNAKVKDQHPGNCPVFFNATGEDPDFSEDLSDHTLMGTLVHGELLMTYGYESFTTMDMRFNAGPHRNLTMMYIGTADGNLLRVLPKTDDWSKAVIIDKMDVFNKEECSNPNNESLWEEDRKVRFVQFDQKTKTLQIGLRNCVIFKPLYWCSQYKCNSTCIGSGDPGCGWSESRGECVEFLSPQQQLDQNLIGAISHPELFPACPRVTTAPPTTVAPAGTTAALINPSASSSAAGGGALGPGKPEDVKSAQVGYPEMLLVLIVIVSVIATLVLVFLFWCASNRCSRKEPDFNQKQLRLQQSEMKHDTSRPGALKKEPSWMQRLLCKCDVWGLGWSAGSKRNSPIGGSPVMSYKEDRDTLINRSSAAGQDYSETPTLPMVTRQGSQRQSQMNVRQEEARRQRHASSRHDSTSSVASRRSNYNMEMKALGRSLSASGQSDIHCNSIPRSDPRPIPCYPTSSSSSSSRKESPPVFHEHGAAESGVLPTASAKMRRRNNERRASRVTNEIMRDSHDAVQQFENVYHSMLQNGFGSGTTPTPPHPHHLRQRLDSDDSGKGASPRNSLQNDMDQTTSVIDGRQVRPSSLHLGRPQHIRRTRLVSEPTYEIQMTPMRPGGIVGHKVAAGSPSRGYPPPQFIFAAAAASNKQAPHADPRGSGMRVSCMRSHPTTPTNPNGGAFIPYQHQHQLATPQQQQQQQQQQANAYPAYATLPKQQSAAMVSGQRPRTRHMSGNLPYQQVQMQPLLKDHQHPIAQPPPHMTSTPVTSASSKAAAGIPNRYPSMMVRGTHANIKSFPRNGVQQQQQQQQQQQRQQTAVSTTSSAQAKNYYPSMPMQESAKSDGSPLEFKMMRRPDQLPVLVRQSSTSSSNASSYHKGPGPVAFETV